MRIINRTSLFSCALLMLACDPAEYPVDENVEFSESETAELLLEEDPEREFADPVEQEGDACDDEELDFDDESNEQEAGLCWVNGCAGSTSTSTQDSYTGQCCGIGNGWKQKKRIKTITCNTSCGSKLISTETSYPCTVELCF